MLSVEQLKTPPTRGEVTQWLIGFLQKFGFQPTGWQEGRAAHTILNMAASGISALGQSTATIANSTTNATASGSALTYYSASRFSNTRSAAVATEGVFVLTSTATVPYEIVPGALSISTPTGLIYTNTSGGTVPTADVLNIDVRCETVGAAGNISNNTTLKLSTPLAGVECTNPSPGEDTQGIELPWYSLVTGQDQELDSELQARNSTQWGLTAVEKTSTALVNLALKQDGIAKATVVDDNPRGDYTVDVYVSAEDALVSTAQITAAQEQFAKYTMFTESVWPVTDIPKPSSVALFNPTPLELLIVGSIYYRPQYSEEEMKSRIKTALDDFVKLTPIGGRTYASGVENVVTVSNISQVIEGVVGVDSATLTSPAGDIKMLETNLLVGPDDWFDATRLLLVQVNR
jgi:uncharacterized phage protein gp47/JayE